MYNKEEPSELTPLCTVIMPNTNYTTDAEREEKMQKYSNEELVEMIRNSDSAEERSLYYGILYQQNKGIIHKICYRYSGYEDINDLMQEAYFGLCDAVEKYDSAKCAKFITYASYWILNKVRRYIADCCSPVSISSGMYDQIIKYKDMLQSFEAEYSRKPTRFEICQAMDISRNQLKNIENAIYILSVVSLNTPISEEEGSASLQDVVPDKQDRYEEIESDIDADILRAVIWSAVDSLEPYEVEVIHKRYEDDKTLREVGSAIGITKDAVKRIETKAISKLRRSKQLKPYINEYMMTSRYYFGGLNSFRNTRTSITERLAIEHYERSEKARLQVLEQQITGIC